MLLLNSSRCRVESQFRFNWRSSIPIKHFASDTLNLQRTEIQLEAAIMKNVKNDINWVP